MEPYEFLLDLTPKGAPAVRVACSQNDVKRPFVAHLTYIGKDFEVPDGSRAEIRVRKPDGNLYIGECTCEQCYVYFQTALQMTCVAGECLSEISIIDADENQIGSWNFIIYVEAGPESVAKKSESSISWLENAREEINNTAEYATEAKQSSEEAMKSETNAKVSSESAKQSASAATTASQTAQTASATASASASAATAKAAEAQTSAIEAKKSETNAKASEQSTSASASAAQNFASKAAASAEDASEYADSALASATQAAGYAGEAEYRLMINPETGHMALVHYTKEE